MSCACGHGVSRSTPRLAAVLPPTVLLFVVVPVTAGLAFWRMAAGHMASGAVGLLVAGAALLAPRFGGRFYWGGLRCAGCGRVTLYR